MKTTASLMLLLATLWSNAAAQAPTLKPETILVTFHARPGAEKELEQVIERHWNTARRLNLIAPEPHLTVRGTEDGSRTYFVHIFTWRDPSIPDAAPPEIQAIWADMNRLVENRGGKPGLNFEEVFPVQEGSR
jgi:hypothetical protein